MISELHTFGWRMEQTLKPVLEAALEQPLTKTAARFDSIDFLGESVRAELKCRRAVRGDGMKIYPDTYSTWLLPCCKCKGDDLIIFYYFESDNSLWYIWHEEEKFSKYERGVPYWKETQEHFYIPKDEWARLEWRE